MLDDKGNLFIIDAVLVVGLFLFAFIVFNQAIFIQDSHYSSEIKDSKTAQDVMESLSGKINFTDKTFLGDISTILKDGKNSKESINKVCELSKDKLSSFNLKNYRFSETNMLDDIWGLFLYIVGMVIIKYYKNYIINCYLILLPWWCSLDNTWDCGSHSPGSNPGQGIIIFRD